MNQKVLVVSSHSESGITTVHHTPDTYAVVSPLIPLTLTEQTRNKEFLLERVLLITSWLMG